jgi:hypothetical protein
MSARRHFSWRFTRRFLNSLQAVKKKFHDTPGTFYIKIEWAVQKFKNPRHPDEERHHFFQKRI